ncbi:hypothetical protein F0562_016866 [Nyssa sinensis]|uniref:Helicase ATP-binding domain-containing protein n=1 Tax=Nyssa sinensis TaxID=561372 RepID=A0A5J4ZGL1_9ASTE|nr:hypothetical protein F0562_016866 [Nyssa sinensis]
MKFERPSKIQAFSLPMILTPPYKNLITQAYSGSGKTTCFVLGMLSRVDPKLSAPQALCICPSRELAIQNMEVLLKMGKYTGITAECAVPLDNSNYIPISKRAPVTAQVVIGTPGTINKWVTAKKLGMSYMKILVLDEANHMLAESGFKDDSLRIMKAIVRSNGDCQISRRIWRLSRSVTLLPSKAGWHLRWRWSMEYGVAQEWEDIEVGLNSCRGRLEFLERCLVGQMGAVNALVPAREKVLQWGVMVGVHVVDMHGAVFLFELPSKEAADRILQRRDWMLVNWNAAGCFLLEGKELKGEWVILMRLPLTILVPGGFL